MGSTTLPHSQPRPSASPWEAEQTSPLKPPTRPLLRDRVTGVADLVSLSREIIGNIWQNIGLALGLKAIFLVTTLTGVTTLWMAILADTGATVLVTANALRLLTYRSRR